MTDGAAAPPAPKSFADMFNPAAATKRQAAAEARLKEAEAAALTIAAASTQVRPASVSLNKRQQY